VVAYNCRHQTINGWCRVIVEISISTTCYDFTAMSRVGRTSIALLFSILAMPIGFILGFYVILLFDRNYHDGASGVGGLVVAVIAAVVTFRFLRKRQTSPLDGERD
jgi:hypothetical protein